MRNALLLCVAGLGAAAFTCAPSNEASDCLALGELFNGTNGGSWRGAEGWAAAAAGVAIDLCQFARVVCSGGRPVELALQANGLSGSLPESLGRLSTLTSLLMGTNALTSSLPASLGALTSLVELYAGYNQLEGTLPETFGSLTSLTMLGLGFNAQLHGGIPATYASLSALTTIYLEGTKLCGALPKNLNTYCATHQSSCDGWPLPACRLAAAAPLACAPRNHADDCSAVSGLYGSTRGAGWINASGWAEAAAGSGSDLCGWHGLACDADGRLTVIELLANGLYGVIPAELSHASRLERMNLLDNRLRGSLPSAVGSLTALSYVNFYNNDLSGTLPLDWSSLSALTWLGLQGNRLQGTLPSSWAQLSSLTALTLGENRLEGSIPASWTVSLTALRFLVLRRNNLSGTIPAELGGLTALTSLGLGQNAALRGALPASLDSLALARGARGTVEFGPGTALCGPPPPGLASACASKETLCEGLPLPLCKV